jgi:Spy/CpxP family protein refolding chaperone
MGMMRRMGPPLLEQLQLSGDQRAQVEAIFTGGRDAIHPLAQQLREKRAALGEAARALPFDETTVRSLAQQAADLHAQLMVARAQIANQLRSLLTEDQRTKLSQLRTERLQQFKEWQRQHPMGRPEQQQS